VLFASASAVRALWPSETAFVAGVVTVTMALTPFSVMLGRYLLKKEGDDSIEEDFEGAGGNVLVIGFGRFGQILAQVLLAKNVNATILDASAERVRQAARFGFRIYFGEGTRRDVLRAAGAQTAAIICVCVDKPDIANRIVDLVMTEFPAAKVFVRSFDRGHTLQLLAKGVDYELRETYESALKFGVETLRGIGFAADEAENVIAEVRERDAERLAVQLSGDAAAGVQATKPSDVTPEPLSPPARRGDGRRREERPFAPGRLPPDRETDTRSAAE
jgi:CPA2 family monovalent cation:H+ antiporter-2